MSSYKGHTVFALIIALIFFHSPLTIALTIISGNIPDFDHKFKKDNVYKLIILGLLVFISLYILKLPYYLGLLIVFLGIIFYFSQHRSFTHSIFGLLTLTATLSLTLIWACEIAMGIMVVNDVNLLIAIIIALLSFLFLNKNILLVFLPLFFISIFILPINGVNYINITFAIFLGLLSHMVLDSFTPAGIKLFAPISGKKVYKNFGLSAIFFLIVLAILIHAPVFFEIFIKHTFI